MTLGDWLDAACARLREAGVESAECDAAWIASEITGKPKSSLRLWRNLPADACALEKPLLKRLAGEPLQYALGCWDFMGLRLRCDSRALIPRADTETLCERALEWLGQVKRPEVLDLCAGTGAIGLAIAKARPDAFVTLADISPEALSLARENAQALGAKVELRLGDLFEAVRGQSFDLIACNPPYISREDMARLPDEVRREPSLALFGGEDGLDFYRRIARELGETLRPDGAALFEIGDDAQAEAVCALLRPLGRVRVWRDLSGANRVVQLEREETSAGQRIV